MRNRQRHPFRGHILLDGVLLLVVLSCSPSGARSSHTAETPRWPVLTDSFPRLDATRLARVPSGKQVYRANIALSFRSGVSDSAKIAFFSRHGMTVLGVTRSGQFFVEIPDPGTSVDSLWAVLARLDAEPELSVVTALPFTPLEPVLNSP